MQHLASQNTMFQLLLLIKFITILFSGVNSSPPGDPITCSSRNRNCTITNSYAAFPDRSVCQAADVAYPTIEEELISVVATATKERRKIKVATRFSHSIPKLVCPDGDDGLLISTKFLNRKLEIDHVRMTISVESGVTLKQLINEAAKAGLTLPHVPYWWGLTVGGMLATGAHGSTLLGDGSSVQDYVIQMRIVTPAEPNEGYAKVRTIVSGDPDLKATRVSLGVLGVISQVTLKLQPLFKRSVTFSVKKDVDLADQVTSFGYQHEFADMKWHPSQGEVVYRIDDRVCTNVSGSGLYDYARFRSMLSTELAIIRTKEENQDTACLCSYQDTACHPTQGEVVQLVDDRACTNVPGNGLHDFFGFRPIPSTLLAMIRTREENQEMTGDVDGRCNDAKLATSAAITSAFGLTNNGAVFTGYPVIGYNHHIQSSGACLDSPDDELKEVCGWDPRVKRIFTFDTAFSISMSKVKSFIQDVQKLNELVPKALCGVDFYNGILMRYVKASTAYLGKQEDSVDFDITSYRSMDPMTPRLYGDIIEEIEQIGVFKYGGLPHWGKNRNVVFKGVIKKYRLAKEFLKVKEKYDPLGLFSNSWTDEVLGLRGGVTIEREGCALEGLCVCSKDTHSAPSKGFFCRPGKVYKKARVCTR